MHIAIISSSVRAGRNSHRIGLYFEKVIQEQQLAIWDLIDLQEYRFPVFEERLRFMKNPSEQILHFAERMTKADGIIVIAPEYNGGYPASLKNIIDLLSEEWKGKPTGIVTASTGPYGGALLLPSLLFSLWKKGVWVVNARYHISKVQESFDEKGHPEDPASADKWTQTFMEQLHWSMEAKRKMQE